MKYLDNIVDTYLLTQNNCRFYSKNGVLYCKIPELSFDERVFVARSFPFEKLNEYICVINEDKEEKGMIRFLDDFDEETKKIINHELDVRYFAPKITKILKLDEKFGYSHWECNTDFGDLSFSVKDTFRSMIRVSDDRMFIVDSDGCRYEIESISKLDKQSYQKIELYL